MGSGLHERVFIPEQGPGRFIGDSICMGGMVYSIVFAKRVPDGQLLVQLILFRIVPQQREAHAMKATARARKL